MFHKAADQSKHLAFQNSLIDIFEIYVNILLCMKIPYAQNDNIQRDLIAFL